jgi:hypothetical protein
MQWQEDDVMFVLTMSRGSEEVQEEVDRLLTGCERAHLLVGHKGIGHAVQHGDALFCRQHLQLAGGCAGPDGHVACAACTCGIADE